MPASEFRRHAQSLTNWIAHYLEHSDRYPVLSQVRPGDIRRALPSAPPREGEEMELILQDFQRVLVPGLTHWNHPRFFAYFAITGSAPGVLAEFLSAALNQQAMLWRTSPSATELEQVVMDWLRQMLGLPEAFRGVIYDTASVSTLHALAAAREAASPDVRKRGLAERLRVYCSDQVHSSIDKAVILLGLGLEALRKIPSDDEFRMVPGELARAVEEDRQAGWKPCAVVATVGTTSTTSVDPIPAVAEICRREGIWLHVDAAYGGAAGIVPEHAHVLEGCDQADSFVINPHKWLFTPFDLSALYLRNLNALTAAFSLVPEYLRTSEGEEVFNLMDTGIQLGRRFRALKLWMILRYFGVEGIRERIRGHIELARKLAGWIDQDPDFERMAPVPMSLVCFRARPAGREWTEAELDELNMELMERVNRQGEIFLSHTRLKGRLALRFAIGHIRTTEEHVRQAWDLLRRELVGGRA
ncbi:MAG: amino acid decarboxylase [Armatimonadetes bacterium]|nr:amino acid decarboxylase [Armatimonadota bacterium]